MCLGAGSPGWIDEALHRMSPVPVKADRQVLRENAINAPFIRCQIES
jgi:hypothetical protein